MAQGLIFDIQGFSIHDGPGCRTLVFLSGCPLRCSWCSNPEGQLLQTRLMYRKTKCIHQHYHCIQACPYHAIQIADFHSYPSFNQSICNRCESMECSNVCLHDALKVAGHYYTVDELMRILLRDQAYWDSQGGVTFTGGEPLLQFDFLFEVLQKCRSSYIHTAIETCAYVETDILLTVLEWLDWLFIDLKLMDSAVHYRETGVSNKLILKNIKTVANSGWNGRLVMRVPIIPGINDNEADLNAMAEFMAELKLKEVNIIPFHRLGNSKYEQLGLTYKFADQAPPSTEALQLAKQSFKKAGLQCYIDFETPF